MLVDCGILLLIMFVLLLDTLFWLLIVGLITLFLAETFGVSWSESELLRTPVDELLVIVFLLTLRVVRWGTAGLCSFPETKPKLCNKKKISKIDDFFSDAPLIAIYISINGDTKKFKLNAVKLFLNNLGNVYCILFEF